jgi:glutathione S-transferase
MHPKPAIRLYSFPLSGHAHRVQLMLSLLDLPHDIINVDLQGGEHKQPAFIARNPRGQVPVIVDGEITLYDSTAILVYLAKQYGDKQWLPEDPLTAAQVQQFLSLASGEIFEGPNRVRLVKLFKRELDYDLALQKAKAVLQLLETHLQQRDFLVGSGPTIADVACYAYVAHVPEGGVELTPYPAVQAWLRKIEALPRFVGMPKSPHVTAA